ncbi:hypothetical protein [Chlamydiifrater phoenicopteri]|uniref:hypothetical protein n=1 Tax=Chlamydiifrater phoenicopteri TaxID=2681469 RepID=UPI001BCBBD43|nr:hypothetical protein [Chlamydiifrater phoenicopteri]
MSISPLGNQPSHPSPEKKQAKDENFFQQVGRVSGVALTVLGIMGAALGVGGGLGGIVSGGCVLLGGALVGVFSSGTLQQSTSTASLEKDD